jgi:four helix bundle protein
VARQLIRCATSGGANYAEARTAASRADFAHKVAIAAKEVSETVYWLNIIQRAHLSEAGVLIHCTSAGRQLVAILTASGLTARGRAAAQSGHASCAQNPDAQEDASPGSTPGPG